MRVRKARVVSAAPPPHLPQRLRKMASNLSAVRHPVRVLSVCLFSLALLCFVSFADIPFFNETDEQFIERQRLLRRTRELRLARDIRRRRARAQHPFVPQSDELSVHDTEDDKQSRHHRKPKSGHSMERLAREVLRPKRTRPRRPRSKLIPPIKAEPSKVGKPAPPTLAMEIHWDDDSPTIKVCRIHQACMNRDGTLLVPRWLEGMQDIVDQCAIGEVQVMQSKKQYNTSSPYIDFDLFGIKPARYHIPHFLTDLLPMLYASEILRPTFSDRKTQHSQCVAEGDKRCVPELYTEPLNIALFLEDRVSIQPDHAWVPQLIAMLPQDPSLAYPLQMFIDGQKTACFKSIVTYPPHSYVRNGRQWYGPQHQLFTKNAISRESVRRTAEKDTPCRVQVVILNRFGWVRRGGYLLGRDIVNIDEIQARLQDAQQNERFKGVLQVDVSVEYFEDTGFREQVGIMQKADVIVGVHGAGLGNLLFAHLDAPLIEVMPFGYYAGPFDRLAEALHLPYKMVVAEPDTENFNECINARAQQMNRPDIAVRGERMWQDALKKWTETGERGLHSQMFNTADMTPIKLCARSQRMRLDADVMARMILEAAESVCNISSNE